MANKVSGRSFLPILLIFILSGLLIFLGRPVLEGWNVRVPVLLAGDAILFLATTVSLLVFAGGSDKNPHAFVRGVYGGVMVKMFVCLLAVLVYAMIARANVNRNGVIGCFVLYIVYTYFEVRSLLNLNRKVPGNG